MSRLDHVLRVGTALGETPTGTKPSFSNGTTPLIEVIRRDGNIETVKRLLDYGTDPNHVNENGETALSLSILRYRHEVVAVLLGYGVIVTDAAIAAFATTAADMENWELRLRDEGASLAELQNLRKTETRWSDIASRLSLYIPEDSPLHPEFTRIFRAMIEHKQRIGFIPATK